MAAIFGKGGPSIGIELGARRVESLIKAGMGVVDPTIRESAEELEIVFLRPKRKLILTFTIRNPLKKAVDDRVTTIELFRIAGAHFLNGCLLFFIRLLSEDFPPFGIDSGVVEGFELLEFVEFALKVRDARLALKVHSKKRPKRFGGLFEKIRLEKSNSP
jgi:hypothetical protein